MLPSDNSDHFARNSKLGAWLYLEELNHRALNEYTAVLGLVRRAARSVSDEASEQALGQVDTRLRAAAMSFLALRPPADGSLRDLGSELQAVCAALTDSALSHRRIALSLVSDPITMSAYRCWQLSLIISELVTNAARHAFRLREEGSIAIQAIVNESNIECTVTDDGICGTETPAGRGTAIVDTLVNDLGGAISRRYALTGSTITFSVPLADATFVPSMKRAINSPYPAATPNSQEETENDF